MNFISEYLEVIENESVIVNLVEETIVWKPSKFNPKLQNDINYWFNYRKENNITFKGNSIN
jgi:hypothetical protein